MDGCVMYENIPRREDRDRDALEQAEAMIAAEAEHEAYRRRTARRHHATEAREG